MNRFASISFALFLIQQVSIALPAAAQRTELASEQQFGRQAFTGFTQTAPTVQPGQAVPDVVPAPGPRLETARAGIAAPFTSKTLTVNTTDDHMGAGQNVAMMVVGGAGLITGLLVGGGAGAAVAIGGAAVGLYGLYNYLK